MKNIVYSTLLLIITAINLPINAKTFDLHSNQYFIGMYAVTPSTDKNFQMLKEAGVEYIHNYSIGKMGEEALKKDIAFLDKAQKNGLKVIYNIYRDWFKDLNNEKLERLKHHINSVKAHPALGVWYIYDEPKISQTSQLRKVYALLKQETPLIPVALCVKWGKEWKKFYDVCDILLFDYYPVKDKPFPLDEIGLFANFHRQASELGKPVIAVPQMFNWRSFPKKFRSQPERLKNMRFPNEQELRYMIYSGLCLGSRGMMFFSFYRGYSSKEGDKEWVKSTMLKTTKELREFVDTVAPAHAPYKFTRAEDTNYYSALWRNENGTYLVLVNNYPLARDSASRWLEDQLLSGELIPVGSTRKIDAIIEDGKLKIKEEIKPWETFVWKIK